MNKNCNTGVENTNLLHSNIMFSLADSAQSTATTCYVNGTIGNHSYAGTQAQPWKTTTKVGSTAKAGDTTLFIPDTAMRLHKKVTHSVGFAAIVLFAMIIAGAAQAATQVSQFGITWTFDKNYTVGQFANGDYWVVGPVNVIMINPMSTVVGGVTKNGTMINPKSGNLATGYGEGVWSYTGFDSRQDAGGTYNAAYNKGRPNGKDISASNPMIVQPGSSVVSSISREELGSWPEKTMQTLTVAVLTVVPAAPAPGSFRPGMFGDDKVVRYNKSGLDYSHLGSLPLVGSNITPLVKGTGIHSSGDASYQDDTLERMVERPWLDYSVSSYMKAQYNTEKDGKEIAGQISQIALALNSSYTNAQKEKLLVGFTQVGIDYYSVHQGSTVYNRTWRASGQEHPGRKFPILFAGVVLNDTNMKGIGDYGIGGVGYSAANYIAFAEDEQTFYVTQYDIDHYAAKPNASQVVRQAINNNTLTYYTQADLNLPEWGFYHYLDPRYDTKDWGASYRSTNGECWGGFVLAAHVMDMKSLWKHNAFFDYVDRQIPIDNYRQKPSWVGSMWSAYRANYGRVWTASGASNLPPNADAGADQTATDTDNSGSQQITLSGSVSSDSDGSITSYVWREGSTQIATGVSPTVTMVVGTHTITLTVTDNGGLADTDTVVITVNAPANNTPPIANAGPDQTVTDTNNNGSQQVALNGSGSSTTNGSIKSYIWIEKSMPITTGISPTITLSVGQHTITLLVVDNDLLTATDTVVITVNAPVEPVGHWKFNDGSGRTAADSSKSNTAASLINGPIWTAQGELNFDGNDDAVEVNMTNMKAGSGTIALWVKPDAFSKNKHFLFGHATQPWGNRIQLYCNQSGELNLGMGNNSALKTSIQTLNAGQWYHIALRWNGISYTVYVDGTPKAIGTYSGLSSLATYADIGNNGSSSARTEAFDGLIDEVRVYNVAIGTEEIANIALVFLPVDDKTVAEGNQLSFSVRTKPGVTMALSDQNLPSIPSFASNTFSWTPDYKDAGTYQVEFTAPHGNGEDFEKIAIAVTDSAIPPVGYWKFNDGSGRTAADSSKSNTAASLINGPIWTAQGELNFDSNDDAVEVNMTNMKAGSGTIALWVKPDAFSKNKHFLFGHATQPWGNRIQLYCNQSGELNLGMGNNSALKTSIQTLNAGQWYHIALRWNGISYTVYVDGTLKALGTYSGLSSLATYADIGNNGSSSARTEAFDGLIDEVRVYNVAIGTEEIAKFAGSRQ